MKFRKKPVVIEAHQWFKNGDHPLDYSRTHDGFENGSLRQFSPEERKDNAWEGDIVRYYRVPELDGQTVCKHCGDVMHNHGWIDTLEGGHIVCPGDWITEGANMKNIKLPNLPKFKRLSATHGDDVERLLLKYGKKCFREATRLAQTEHDMAREASEVIKNFEISGPDGDGLMWLLLHGDGVRGSAMFNLGPSDGMAAQIALIFEKERRAAIRALKEQS